MSKRDKGRKSKLNFKYHVIKSMRNRAITFRDKANTKEEKDAWNEVVSWFNSFLKPEFRIFTRKGAIGLKITIKDIPDVFNDDYEDNPKEMCFI